MSLTLQLSSIMVALDKDPSANLRWPQDDMQINDERHSSNKEKHEFHRNPYSNYRKIRASYQ